MITVNLTADEAQAVADAVRELVERSRQNELILGPIDWDDLRTAGSKLTEAIGTEADGRGGVRAEGGEMRYDLTVEAARRICGVELNSLHAGVKAAARQGHPKVPASACLTEVSVTRSLVDSWRGRFGHSTPELDTVVESLDAEIKWAEDKLASLAA